MVSIRCSDLVVHAAAAGEIRPRNVSHARSPGLPFCTIRNSVDTRTRRHSAPWQLGSGLHAHDTRQVRNNAAFIIIIATACRAHLRQLYLTTVPAGGPCPEQTL